jgi:hypothetical protein
MSGRAVISPSSTAQANFGQYTNLRFVDQLSSTGLTTFEQRCHYLAGWIGRFLAASDGPGQVVRAELAGHA